jgi:hypothetical protein
MSAMAALFCHSEIVDVSHGGIVLESIFVNFPESFG